METILIIEDDSELNQGISYALRRKGYCALSAELSARRSKKRIGKID